MLNGRNPFYITDAPHHIAFAIIYIYAYERNFLETSGPLKRRRHIPNQIQRRQIFTNPRANGMSAVPWYGYLYLVLCTGVLVISNTLYSTVQCTGYLCPCTRRTICELVTLIRGESKNSSHSCLQCRYT